MTAPSVEAATVSLMTIDSSASLLGRIGGLAALSSPSRAF